MHKYLFSNLATSLKILWLWGSLSRRSLLQSASEWPSASKQLWNRSKSLRTKKQRHRQKAFQNQPAHRKSFELVRNCLTGFGIASKLFRNHSNSYRASFETTKSLRTEFEIAGDRPNSVGVSKKLRHHSKSLDWARKCFEITVEITFEVAIPAHWTMLHITLLRLGSALVNTYVYVIYFCIYRERSWVV